MKKLPLFAALVLVTGIITLTGCVRKDLLPEETGFTGWMVGEVSDGYGTILKTADDGFNWTRQGSISMIPGVNLYDVSCISGNIAWVVGDTLEAPTDSTNQCGVILRTDDGGYSWTRLTDTLLMHRVVFHVVNARGNGLVWAGGDRSTLLRSDNNGATWDLVTPDTLNGVTFSSVTIRGGHRVWVTGNRYDSAGTFLSPVMLRSYDGGTNWQLMQPGHPGPYHQIHAVNDTILLLAAGNEVLRSIDSAETWSNSYASGNTTIRSVAGDTLTYVASGDSGRVCIMQKGLWKTMFPQSVRYVQRDINTVGGTRIWTAGAGFDPVRKGLILYTRNSGETWFIQEIPVNAPLNASSFVQASR